METACYGYDALDQLTQAWTATDACKADSARWREPAVAEDGVEYHHTYSYGDAGHPNAMTSATTTGANASTRSQTMDAVGNSLDILWDDSYYDELVSLAQDRSYRRDREMITLGLARSARPEAGAVLIKLLDDRDVSGHAVKALRKRNEPRARAGLKRMLDDDRSWVRKEARRALDALG